MQIKEAIEFLSRYLDNEYYTNKCNKAHQIAISALEKEIPKKVKVEKRSKDLSILVCPICSKPSLVGMSYCRFCGQRLDWSEENA